jgi:hypothetical protein
MTLGAPIFIEKGLSSVWVREVGLVDSVLVAILLVSVDKPS